MALVQQYCTLLCVISKKKNLKSNKKSQSIIKLEYVGFFSILRKRKESLGVSGNNVFKSKGGLETETQSRN